MVLCPVNFPRFNLHMYEPAGLLWYTIFWYKEKVDGIQSTTVCSFCCLYVYMHAAVCMLSTVEANKLLL
jgi:hypothetical protein